MAIVTFELDIDQLPELAEKPEIEAGEEKDRPFVYDEDCPPLTEQHWKEMVRISDLPPEDRVSMRAIHRAVTRHYYEVNQIPYDPETMKPLEESEISKARA